MSKEISDESYIEAARKLGEWQVDEATSCRCCAPKESFPEYWHSRHVCQKAKLVSFQADREGSIVVPLEEAQAVQVYLDRVKSRQNIRAIRKMIDQSGQSYFDGMSMREKMRSEKWTQDDV